MRGTKIYPTLEAITAEMGWQVDTFQDRRRRGHFEKSGRETSPRGTGKKEDVSRKDGLSGWAFRKGGVMKNFSIRKRGQTKKTEPRESDDAPLQSGVDAAKGPKRKKAVARDRLRREKQEFCFEGEGWF